jgi:hypothetical protein
MSGMRECRIALDRDAPHHEPNERGTAARDDRPEKLLPFIQRIAQGVRL